MCSSWSAVVSQARNSAWLTASGARHCAFQSLEYLGISRVSHMSMSVHVTTCHVSEFRYVQMQALSWLWLTMAGARPWRGFIRMELLCKPVQWPGSKRGVTKCYKDSIRFHFRFPDLLHSFRGVVFWILHCVEEGLLETWNNANADLDMVQKGTPWEFGTLTLPVLWSF